MCQVSYSGKDIANFLVFNFYKCELIPHKNICSHTRDNNFKQSLEAWQML